jgi:pyruvate kinase
VSLTAGDSFRLSLAVGGEKGNSSAVGIEYQDLPKSVEIDDVLLLDDGKMQLRVDSVSDSDIDCTVLIGGKLSSRKGVNKLGGGIAAPALTEKDKADIRAMESIKPDFVAVSFVAAVQDIEEARGLLQEARVDAAIIAKIERAEVVADRELLDSIIDACEGVMVARGDLG